MVRQIFLSIPILFSLLFYTNCLGMNQKSTPNDHPLNALLLNDIKNYIATFLIFPDRETDTELKERLQKNSDLIGFAIKSPKKNPHWNNNL